MNIITARKTLIISSLVITGCQIIFFTIAPVLGFPIEYPKNIDLLQIISPVFFGYLGTATHFIFITPRIEVHAENEFLGILIKGPLIIYSFVVIATTSAFWFSNRPGATVGSGMSVENLSTALSLALGLLAVTTGVINSYLFSSPNKP
jgi:hypothetical protein